MAQIPGSDRYLPWFAGKAPAAAPRLRLFCFPYAGLGTSAFRGWATLFPAGVDVLPVQFPGRESRHHEPPVRRMNELAAATFEAVAPFTDVPFAFVGHSLGAAVAYEVARLLPPGAPLQRLVVSARRAPHLPDRQSPISHLPTEQFLPEVCRRYDGIPAAVLESPDLLELLLPRLRADLELLETYAFTGGEPLGCPISVFGGTHDSGVPAADLDGWRQHTRAAVTIRMVDGPHLFLQTQRAALAASIAADLGLEQPAGAQA